MNVNGIVSNTPTGEASACIPAAIPLRPPAGRLALARSAQALAILALAFGFYLLFSRFVVQSVTVRGVSMVPTLRDSERYLLNRWIYHVRAPRSGELVVLEDPSDHGLSVKRIVAVPGDTVRVSDRGLRINGTPVSEPYLDSGTVTLPVPSKREQNFACGRREYFVLGDNRNNSIDSRVYGPVPRANIRGLIVR